MSRTFDDGLCPDCGEAPTRGNEEFLQCACPDKKWHDVAGVEGMLQESEIQ